MSTLKPKTRLRILDAQKLKPLPAEERVDFASLLRMLRDNKNPYLARHCHMFAALYYARGREHGARDTADERIAQAAGEVS